ncbi:MAG TPA: fumarylacetoacetate hydrolase family protein [Burkholderiales bacterium]|nr:fumarylacetoacetate hydrolase family protein [Burkholderiales bacterium]
MKPPSKAAAAAQRLLEAHQRREPFTPLPSDLSPASPEEAYGIQDAFVALRAQSLGAIAGYKVALASEAMRRLVGVDSPQLGTMLESSLRRSPARVRTSDYVHLLVEFEIGVEMAEDLPAADAPFTRERVAAAVGAVMPAIELADDRNADYASLARHPLDLIADNGWSEGAVLGPPVFSWKGIDLGAVRGVATINGQPVGEGRGAEAMGHPFDSVAWVANHLAAHGRGLLRSEVVITGSLVTSKFPRPGDVVSFAVDGLGSAELRVK